MSVRRPLIAGNWKMYKTPSEAGPFAAAVAAAAGRPADRDVLVCPPFTAIPAVAAALRDTPVLLGAQNLHHEEEGAFTGETSPGMLADLGVRFVICGHSERRHIFGETDETVGLKAAAAARHGMTPVVCVGETLAERDAGATVAVVARQLDGALAGCGADMVVAYEPVWAIGTGRTATPGQAEEVHAFIRGHFLKHRGEAAAAGLRILYGGSVKPDNVDALMAEADIDGALVGGASLKADAFARIVNFKG